MPDVDRVHDSRSVANYLIAKKAAAGGLDALQVMKLVYLCHGFKLAIYGKPLIEDDIEAWKYGPVIRRVYQKLPSGRSPITTPISDHVADFSEEERAILDDVLTKYGHLSGVLLSTLTHRDGSPWDLTWRQYGRNAVIPQEWIEAHFKKQIADRPKAA